MRTIALSLLVACAAEPTADLAPAALPVAAAAGPFLVPFQVPAIYPGQSALLGVSGLPTGARVTFLRSERGAGAGPCHPTYPICAGLLGPLTVLGNATVAAGGNAALTWNVPNNASAGQWLQAVVTIPNTTLAASSAVFVRVPGDGDLDFVPDAFDNCPADPNPGQLDADGDDFGDGCDCDDSDPAVNPNAIEIPGNPVDEDCDGITEGAWDGTYQGTINGVINTPFGFNSQCSGTIDVDVAPGNPAPVQGFADCFDPQWGPFTIDFSGTLDGDHIEGMATSNAGQAPFAADMSVVNGSRQFATNGTLSDGFITLTYDAVAVEL